MTAQNADPPPNENLSRTWVDEFYEQINQVQQRFNYFLIATSFLFVAFVTLVTSSTPNLCKMIIAVASFGILLSLYYFEISYHQTRVAQTVRDNKISDPSKIKVEPKKWTLESICDAFAYFFPFRAFKFAKERPANYTWVIPIGFTLFWIFSLVWFLVWS